MAPPLTEIGVAGSLTEIGLREGLRQNYGLGRNGTDFGEIQRDGMGWNMTNGIDRDGR